MKWSPIFCALLTVSALAACANQSLDHPSSTEYGLEIKPKAFVPHLYPPKGWEKMEDHTQLPEKVVCIYIGSGKGAFTPSINIAAEPTEMDLNAYVEQAISYHNKTPQTRCSVLGQAATHSGIAQILRIDRTTQWGEVRFIQAVLIADHTAYVVTATCLQGEFAHFAPQFFKAIQSFSLEDVGHA